MWDVAGDELDVSIPTTFSTGSFFFQHFEFSFSLKEQILAFWYIFIHFDTLSLVSTSELVLLPPEGN